MGAFALVGVGVAGPAALMAWVRSPLHTGKGEPIVQPVAFDHRHHVRDDGIDCRYCHYDVERSPMAGVPDTGLCMNCHAQIWTDSPLLEPVRKSYFEKEPIRWERVNVLPDFVFFNHSIHVSRGVGCEACHGRVDLMAGVQKASSLDMDFCLGCHREPWKHLRPADAVTQMGYVPSEPQAELGWRLQREHHINPPTYCSGCHR